MQSVNPVLPEGGFAPERLLAPQQALVAFFARVAIGPVGTERVGLGKACGRVLAESIAADADYPDAARSVMDGFALRSQDAPGAFEIAGEVAMGAAPTIGVSHGTAMRIPTGGVMPRDADAVVPVEEARVDGERLRVDAAVARGENTIERGADMHCGDALLAAGRRIGAGEIGLLATLGKTDPLVYRRPAIAVFSSGDELVEPHYTPRTGEIRDSNRYAIAASLRAMGAQPRHYPTLRDEQEQFEMALSQALGECDAIVVSGGSSVGERDRLRETVDRIASPGVIVHGLRVKPGKPTLFGAHGSKPIVGLPGNPMSALFVLEGVAAPIIAALTGAALVPATLQARLDGEARSRAGWTWYVPVSLRHDGTMAVAHPLAVRSFSVSLAGRADGYLVMAEADELWKSGSLVTVTRFYGS